ncbi:MAG: helix-turn-helix domain-containing protein [Oscillospiraceae bacterium]|nr:helix-turn-helix domain-containing protein [Oscillospiraceae bacterium]
MGLGENIKEIRMKKKLTLSEFAEILSLSISTVAGWERGIKKPSYDVLIDIANKFNVSLDWLCGIKTKDGNAIKTWGDAMRRIAELMFTHGDAFIDIKLDLFRDIDGDEAPRAVYLIFYDGYINDALNSKTYVANEIDFTYKYELIEESPLSLFLRKYKKMYDLYHNESIDDELFELWLEREYEKYNYPITPTAPAAPDSDNEV